MTVRARGYEPMYPIARRVADRWLASGDPYKIVRALIRMSMHGPDFEYTERRALEFASHPDPSVRCNAATALSHVARVHGSLDVDAVMTTLVRMLDDPHPDVFGFADDALDEVEHHMKTDRRRYMAAAHAGGI